MSRLQNTARLLTAGVLGLAFLATATAAHAEFPEGPLVMEWLGAEGTGCPDGSAAAAVSPDNRAITVPLASYLVTPAGTTTQNCRMRVAIHGADDYTFAVRRMSFQGGGQLSGGSRGELRYRYSFGDSAATEHVFPLSTDLRTLPADPFNPENYPWEASVEVADEDLVWAPCDGTAVDRELVIDTTLSITGTATSELQLSYVDMSTGTETNAEGAAWCGSGADRIPLTPPLADCPGEPAGGGRRHRGVAPRAAWRTYRRLARRQHRRRRRRRPAGTSRPVPPEPPDLLPATVEGSVGRGPVDPSGSPGQVVQGQSCPVQFLPDSVARPNRTSRTAAGPSTGNSTRPRPSRTVTARPSRT